MENTLNNNLFPVLKARLIIGYLGEAAQFGWWQTAFYEESSQAFLQPIFPKTMHLAQYRGVVEAACRLHDEHLNVGAYHLFRLPEELEQSLHALAQDMANKLAPIITSGGAVAANNSLSDLAGEFKKEGVGPVSVGSVRDLSENLAEIASVYRFAFSSNTQSLPFLAG